MREHNGVHTCDKRRTRSDIHAAFPEYDFEEGFAEKDELWTSDYRETHDDIDRRARLVLDMIFHNDVEQCGRCLSLSFFSFLVSLRSMLKLTRGSVSYIDHSAWRHHWRFLADVQPSPLDSAHGRFVPALTHPWSRLNRSVCGRNFTGGRERVCYWRKAAQLEDAPDRTPGETEMMMFQWVLI
jgi:hypothetical protein